MPPMRGRFGGNVIDTGFFVHYLKDFVERHGISDNLLSRFVKLSEEVKKLDEAILAGDKEEIAKEAADVAIIAFHVMIICGVMPLTIMYCKLNEVASRPKYKRLAGGFNVRDMGANN